MTKIKIKDLATELGVIYADLVTQVNSQFGLDIKGPLSMIDEEEANRIREWMLAKGNQFAIEEKRVASRVIRRRKVTAADEQPKAAEPEPKAAVAIPVSVEETVTKVVEPTNHGDPHTTAAAVEHAGKNGAAKAIEKPAAVETIQEAQASSTNALEQTVEETEEAPSSQTPGEEPRRKRTYSALKVVEAQQSRAPEVREAPIFSRPTEQPKPTGRFAITTKPVAEGTAPTTDSSYDPRTAEQMKQPMVRREVIEIREITRPKQFGKRKVVAKKPGGKTTEITTPKAIKRIIKMSDSVTINELAKRMAVKASDVIGKAMGMGMMVTINHSIDAETASILANEFAFEIENIAADADEIVIEQPASAGDLKPRPPVVTIMGHVDHGKTSLLDYIRKTNVVKKEFGGITQHIGAYDVRHSKGHIIFLDTPGHEAFTAMRARGATVTDIVVLVVAADDGVMPQTRESINHAKAAKVPIIVAINKMDKPEANPERIKQDLTEFGLVPEAWGGDTIFVPVSAKSGQGINELLDMLILQADVMQLKSDPSRLAKGIIIESKLDRGRGAVATVLVQEGTLRVGDAVVCGAEFGRVRSLVNDLGERVKEAGPSIPVEVVGLSGIVQVGDVLNSLSDEKKARQIAMVRQERAREKSMEANSKLTLDQLYNQIQKGEAKELKVVVKGDVMGSIEAIIESLKKLNTDQVNIVIIHNAVGGISESDVMLASASKALIIGFNVRPDSAVQQLAEKQGVEVRLYTVIYDMVEEIKKAMSGMLAPKEVEQVIGHVQIKEVFNIGKVGTIGGGTVTDGRVTRSARIRVLRDSVIVHNGSLASLKRFKDDAREVKSGLDCGLSVANFNDIKPGDIIEAYDIVEVRPEA